MGDIITTPLLEMKVLKKVIIVLIIAPPSLSWMEMYHFCPNQKYLQLKVTQTVIVVTPCLIVTLTLMRNTVMMNTVVIVYTVMRNFL